MPEEEQVDLDELTQENDGDDELVRTLRSRLREEAAGRKAAEADKAKAAKEAAFIKLGIDTSKGAGKLFYESYDGELTAEAVKATAESYELSFESQEQPTTEATSESNEEGEVVSEEERAAHEQIQQATSGAPASEKTKVDPFKEVADVAAEADAQGATFEDRFAKAFQTRVSQAMEGDDRVIVDTV